MELEEGEYETEESEYETEEREYETEEGKYEIQMEEGKYGVGPGQIWDWRRVDMADIYF